MMTESFIMIFDYGLLIISLQKNSKHSKFTKYMTKKMKVWRPLLQNTTISILPNFKVQLRSYMWTINEKKIKFYNMIF